MRIPLPRLARVLGAGAAVLMVAAGPAAAGGEAATAGGRVPSAAATSSAVCPPASARHWSCLALKLDRAAKTPAKVRPSVAAPPTGSGYGPSDIQSAYGLTSTASTNGANQTIGLVEAYHAPSAAADLAFYRSSWGLPACTVASGCFQQVDMSNGTGTSNSGWEQEATLDMDAVSAACPLCHILLVEAVDDTDTNLIAAVQRAASLGATVLNLSFGGCEGGQSYESAFQAANIPIAVATGDSGYYAADNPGCPTGTPQYPASSPHVTAVGGTSLTYTGSSGRPWSETAWQYGVDPQTGQPFGGGSGCSSIPNTKPSWQTDTGCPNRTVADISADADPNTGIAVYISDPTAGGPGWLQYGGTSLAAPIIAATYALAGSPSTAVDGHVWYMGAALNDVTSGSNAASSSDCNPRPYLCNAEVGYDGPTGMGTPNGPPITNATMATLPTTSTATAIPLSWSPPPNVHPASYQVWEQDTTSGGGWLKWVTTTSPSTTFYGFRGHGYQFSIQYFNANGSSNGQPGTAEASTTVSSTATESPGFAGMYAVDGSGTLHPGSSPPLPATFGFPWDIARSIVTTPTGQGGLVLDGFGGLHNFGDSPPAQVSGYWQGWDIAGSVVALPQQSSTQWSGFVMDDWGGLHGYTVGGGSMPTASGFVTYHGWAIVNAASVFSDGSGGLTLDGWGGIHPFAVGSNPQPVAATYTGYWYNWDIARSMVLLPGSTSTHYQGYVLDGWGNLHPFASQGTVLPPTINSPFFQYNWDIARSVILNPGSSTQGYVVDGFGGFHPFGGAATVLTPNYGVNGSAGHGAASA